MKFKNKKALVTGSSRGIGKAIALQLASQGADILLHYRRDEKAAQETSQEIKNRGRKVWSYAADLSATDGVESLLTSVKKDHETLDIFIANAASTSFKPLADLELHHIEKTLRLVVSSFILAVSGLIPLLQMREAHIVAISGIDTIKTFPGHGLLASAKSALETLSKYFSVELAPLQIHVNTVNPGFVDTDSTRFYLGESFSEITGMINQLSPQKGVGSPIDVANVVSFLCSKEADWITGQTIYADGGIATMLPISHPG